MSDTSGYRPASEQTPVPPRLPSLDERYPGGTRRPRAGAASHCHERHGERLRHGGQPILRIAPADCCGRAVATVGRTGDTVDRRSRVPGCATSSGSPARARGGVQDDRRRVGGVVNPARARLPLPCGAEVDARNARESRARTCETGARRARLASVPREGAQPGRHDGPGPPRDQQPGGDGSPARCPTRTTDISGSICRMFRQPAAHEDAAERTRTWRRRRRAAVQPQSRPARERR